MSKPKSVQDLVDKCDSPASEKNSQLLIDHWPHLIRNQGMRLASGTEIGAYFYFSSPRHVLFKVEIGATDRESRTVGTKSPRDVLSGLLTQQDGYHVPLPDDVSQYFRKKTNALFKRIPGSLFQEATCSAPLAEMSENHISEFLKLCREVVDRVRKRILQNSARTFAKGHSRRKEAHR